MSLFMASPKSAPSLLAHPINLTRAYLGQNPQDLWNERQERLELVTVSDEHDYRNIELRNALLVAQALVCRDKDIEPGRCGREQVAVRIRRPTHFRGSSNFVVGKVLTKAPRDALIQQNQRA